MSIQAGTYQFNTNLTLPSSQLNIYAKFYLVIEKNEEEVITLSCQAMRWDNINKKLEYFVFQGNSYPQDWIEVYTNKDKWKEEVYKTIIFSEDVDGGDFENWFNSNTSQQTPKTTSSYVIARTQHLIDKANSVTSNNDTTLTASVNALIEGYGTGTGQITTSNVVHGIERIPLNIIIEDYLLDINYNYLAFDTTDIIFGGESSSVLGKGMLGYMILG